MVNQQMHATQIGYHVYDHLKDNNDILYLAINYLDPRGPMIG